MQYLVRKLASLEVSGLARGLAGPTRSFAVGASIEKTVAVRLVKHHEAFFILDPKNPIRELRSSLDGPAWTVSGDRRTRRQVSKVLSVVEEPEDEEESEEEEEEVEEVEEERQAQPSQHRSTQQAGSQRTSTQQAGSQHRSSSQRTSTQQAGSHMICVTLSQKHFSVSLTMENLIERWVVIEN
ncbi:hypothetical protein L211DRAFT_849253 [Terfezia boudieri ATCC MYA-4762]|uniref:Uncharacterized protein n=1 Tax=Terfezia boudieri ATCC MYA-4762 TaxID=1051890 RepID=A0A3N4LMF7_9PEZI|nr:hypothetical protein L211DRAFT_849253 [Terfezia boudieri ATCC MYA-4762]